MLLWRGVVASLLLAIVIGLLGALLATHPLDQHQQDYIVQHWYFMVRPLGFFVVYWWALFLLLALAFTTLAPFLILFDKRQPFWIRVLWTVSCWVTPLAQVAYWFDCVERTNPALQRRATRVAGWTCVVLLLVSGISDLVWPTEDNYRLARMALSLLGMAFVIWLISKLVDRRGTTVWTVPAPADATPKPE